MGPYNERLWRRDDEDVAVKVSGTIDNVFTDQANFEFSVPCRIGPNCVRSHGGETLHCDERIHGDERIQAFLVARPCGVGEIVATPRVTDTDPGNHPGLSTTAWLVVSSQ